MEGVEGVFVPDVTQKQRQISECMGHSTSWPSLEQNTFWGGIPSYTS